MPPTQSRRKFGMWTTHDGRSLHDSLGATIRANRARLTAARARAPLGREARALADREVEQGRAHAACLRWLPGTTFTDGEHMYEVVYGCQGLGSRPAGWVACVRTDWIDNGPPEGKERTCYQLFMWDGKPRDGVIIGGKRRPFILRFVAAAPRLVVA